MSTYHYAVKKLLSEIDRFFNFTLKSENLSKKADKEKEKIIESIQKLFADYTSLAPSGDEGSTSSARDTGANSSFGEDSQITADNSLGSEDDNYSDNFPDTTVKALSNPIKTGYLEKKNSGTLLVTLFTGKKKYCVLHKNVLYCFKKPDDKKQQCAFCLTGYEFREAPQNQKDQAKKDFCFELVCPGKKTHQFLASSKEDVQSWKEAFQSVNNISAENGDITDGDIYEEMPAEKTPVRKLEMQVPVPVPAIEASDDLYEDGTSLVSSTSLPLAAEPKKPVSPSLHVPKVTVPEKEIEDYDDDSLIYEPVDTPSRPPPSPVPASPAASVAPPPLPPHIPRTSPLPVSGLPDNSAVPPPLPSRNVPLPPPPTAESVPQLPQHRKKNVALGKILHPSEDFENMFYGIWKSESLSPQELSFDRGQIIHVISRDLDSDDWWVGELEGKIGLVPKTFLAPAYELVC
ncbi:hypothetical protein Btru_017944 [Bulinus truncatus]|nr:hypothetical protein Btru_017944 [Bulinus truncatus]